MDHTDEDDGTEYAVVVNDEEQYSIWPAGRPLPAGWRAEGTTGPKDVCLAHIATVWTDMRPASLRSHMDEAAQEEPEGDLLVLEDDTPHIVDRLADGDHDVVFTARPEATVEQLREGLERGLVFVRFTGTRGGTELGVRLATDDARQAIDALDADAESVRFSGSLTLDLVPATCHVDLTLDGLAGTGRLERAAG